MTVKNLEKNVLQLNPIDRLHIAESIIASLNEPDPALERAWAKESDRRLAVYKKSKAKAVSFETIKKQLIK